MTKADEACYSKRYGDVPKTMTGRTHYQEVGSDQGRLPSCARNLTEYEAQRYIDNSPVLQRTIGRSGRAAGALSRNYFLDHGYNNATADAAVATPSWDSVFSCGNTADKAEGETESCKCGGIMHYGLLKSPASGADLGTLTDMRQWKTFETRTQGSEWTSCEHKSFGLPGRKDFMPDTDFQCWCERKPKPVPTYCADYGGDCLCSGLVFQMVKGTGAAEFDFFKGFGEPYTANNVNAT